MNLENIETMVALLYLRDILIRERRRGYYRKNTNIQESFVLSKESVFLYSMDYCLVQEGVVYQNGMTDFVQYTVPDYSKKSVGRKKIKTRNLSSKSF